MRFFAFAITLVAFQLHGQEIHRYFLTADRVYDGEAMHEGWAVAVENDRITAVGPKEKIQIAPGAIRINYPNSTITPGMIEGHSHLFLYAYNITDWNTQVLKESDTYRTVRATVHAKATLMAGFTTTRDLGTEGAGYADVGLKRAIDEGIIPGPRMLVAGRAIVATGAYGPKGFDTDMEVMQGAESADGEKLIAVTRDQIGKGADLIKIYADYHWNPKEESRPTFSLNEIRLVVETARSAGRPVVAHAQTIEGIRRAVLAGVETIEHGDEIDEATGKLMKEHGVIYFATLAAVESNSRYKGWIKGASAEPPAVTQKKRSFAAALNAGVTIGMGGDVGVFTHGENVLEMELMEEYGMKGVDVLHAATGGNSKAFHLEGLTGFVKPGLKADLIIVSGNPALAITNMRKILWVMKDGVVYRD